jgi:precorrin-6B methylase 2
MQTLATFIISAACICTFGCGLSEHETAAGPAGLSPVTTIDAAPASGSTAITESSDEPMSEESIQPIQSSDSDVLLAADADVAEGDQSGASNEANPDQPASHETTTEESVATDDPDAEPRYTYSDDHDPNGIGKFYMGREIAMVMGHQGIAWLERPERDAEEGLSLLIECLDIEPGSTVADIGAGSGVLTTRFCEAVGEEGTVVAVDIQQEMLDALQLKMHEQGYRNVELVLGTPESPQLEPGTLDLVVMVDVYHEFEFPYEMLLNISAAMRPGGRVVFVEYRKEDPDVLIKLVHKMTEEQVILEASRPEFQLEYVETIADLPVQHVIVFRRVEAETESTE